jgi:DNA mismatch repair ATPase MutS
LVEVEAIRERHDVVSVLAEQGGELRSSLQEEGFCMGVDLHSIMKKLENKSAKLKDLCALYTFTKSTTRLVEIMEEGLEEEEGEGASSTHGVVRKRVLEPMKQVDASFAKYRSLIETVVDMQALGDSRFLISAQHSPELQEIFTEQEEVGTEIQRVFDEAVLGWGETFKKKKDSKGGSELKLKIDPVEGHVYRAPKAKHVQDAIKNQPKFR